MTYLEAVALIKRIEQRYDMRLIKYKDEPIWPLLRINIIDTISGNNNTMKSTGSTAVKQVLKTLFYYNPLNFFRKYKLWLFAGYERRKVVGNHRLLRVSGCVIEAEPNTLVIEKPSKNQNTHHRRDVPEKSIVSESWLLMFVHALAIVFRPLTLKIENENILKSVLDEYNIKFDYISAIRILASQKIVFDCILAVLPKPEKVIIECPYTIMGYVWSLHNHGIPVIELQHGVLNDKHYAYNSLYPSKSLYPDILCVFGEDEYNYLKSSNCHYCNDIRKTGLYFMEVAQKSFLLDPFAEYRTKYKYIVLIAGQRGYEAQMAEYVRKVSSSTPDCLYAYVPRSADTVLSFSETNIIFCPGVNIYEYMIWCDLHITISSTTCLECQYYHKPTIFYNYADMSESYYRDVLTEKNGALYTNSVDEYLPALQKMINGKFDYKEVFTHDTVKKIKEIINE